MQMTGLATWAALSDSGIENLLLPDDARDILICADHDKNGVGQTAARRAAEKWIAGGRRVEIALPKEPDTDFNDLLRADVSDLPAPFFRPAISGNSP
jgi:putative DNA primase/helicase